MYSLDVQRKKQLYFVTYFFSRSSLYYNLFSFLFFCFYCPLLFDLGDRNAYILISILVFQSQQSSSLPNGTLFQVKVAYPYIPVHDDELSINPNDIINVTRLVCGVSFLHRKNN
jgi:hypothetical protein